MSSLTPQDNARAYSQPNPPRHVFAGPSLPTPSPSHTHQSRPSFRLSQVAGLRPPQHRSPYTTPYASPNNPSGLSRQNPVTNGGGVSAEQQIAQGVLNSSPSNVPNSQRRPPPLGTTIHMPTHCSPQIRPISIHHTLNPPPGPPQGRDFGAQRQSQTASPSLQQPSLQNITNQRPVMSSSPANSGIGGSRPQASPSNGSQDMSMIDPQLAIDQQLTDTDNQIAEQQSPPEPPVTQGEPLSAPPGGSFPTFDSLFAAAQAHALAHGYAFVIGRSKRDNRGLKKVFLICDRGGTNKEKVPGEHRQRKTKSRKCGCEFGVFGLETKQCWILRGRMDGEHLTHNHPPSESPTEHPGARKLDPKAIAAVKTLEENGVSVKETLEILHRENPSTRFLPRDIYNARAAIKRDPSRVESTALESLPTFYKKKPMTFEEKLRAELRTEVANAQSEVEKTKAEWQKEVEDLKEQIRQKDKTIQKFEMFIDICNERVMVQRERLAEGEGSVNAST